MANSINKPKINPQTVDKAKSLANTATDYLAKLAGALFFLATSYGYVSGWLKLHQPQHDLSAIGATLTVSVALFLYTRKR